MPLYEYRCHTCDAVFELRRPMSAANEHTDCPGGHADTVRLLSVFATTGTAVASPMASAASGGCCGGACGCGH